MQTLNGKKLLILGGDASFCDVVQAAKELGVYTVVTDWNEPIKSPAKLLADEYWNLSITDYENLKKRIEKDGIDGIITGYHDSYLLPYQKLCELTQLPCYISKETFELTMDKANFKKLCRKNGILTIPEFQLNEFDPSSIGPNNSIIIKPVDNFGSRGVIKCKKEEDFNQCLDYAYSFSAKKEIIIERFMDMSSITAFYTLQDGKCSLSSIDDRIVHLSKDGSGVTCLGIYPSRFINEFISGPDIKIRKMFESAGLKNGVLSMQLFTNGKDFYAHEMGYRLTGGHQSHNTKAENDISGLECLIRFAITGKMADFNISDRDNPYFKNYYYNVYVLGKEGKISQIKGEDFVTQMPEVIYFSILRREGDKIGKDGTAAQKIADIHLKVNNENEKHIIFDRIQNHFKILNADGENLMLKIGE